MTKAADRFFLDLAYTLTGKVELLTDLFEGHGMFAVESEVQGDNVRFTLGQSRQCALNFAAQ